MSKVFWAVKYGNDVWVSQVKPTRGSTEKKQRRLFPSQQDALREAAEIVYPPVTLVRVTRKPKAPPPLKVGFHGPVTLCDYRNYEYMASFGLLWKLGKFLEEHDGQRVSVEWGLAKE